MIPRICLSCGDNRATCDDGTCDNCDKPPVLGGINNAGR